MKLRRIIHKGRQHYGKRIQSNGWKTPNQLRRHKERHPTLDMSRKLRTHKKQGMKDDY